MNSATDGTENSQPRTEGYLQEDKLEAENNARVFGHLPTLTKEGDSAKVGELST